jgi:uncharacterized protein YkwD
MARLDYFSHDSPSGCDLECRFTTTAYPAWSWGENIADYRPADWLTATAHGERFVAEWLTSRGHRDNILSRTFTNHGIGYAIAGDRLVVTVIFAEVE